MKLGTPRCACGAPAKVKTGAGWQCYACARAWVLSPLRGVAIFALVVWFGLAPLWMPAVFP